VPSCQRSEMTNTIHQIPFVSTIAGV
jgi:hypothetical protein